jgi:VanZ family protein
VSALAPALLRPRLWRALWGLAIVAVFVVCLLPGADLPPVPEGGDKVEHFVTYLLLAWGAVQLFARPRPLLLALLGLVLMGGVIEVLQGALTVDRAADPADALANTLGVLAGAALRLTPLRWTLQRLDRRLFGR